MAFNKVFNSEEVARLKKLIQEGDQVLYEVDALQTGLRETVKAIAEEMDIRSAIKQSNPRLPTRQTLEKNLISSMNLKQF